MSENTLLVLWIFTSNISPHFAEFAGTKLKIISANILNALFLKFAKSGAIYCCWIFQMFIHSLKKIKERGQISTVKWSISLLIEHALIIWDKIKTLQVRPASKKRKHQTREFNTKQRQKKNREKLTNFYSCYDDWFSDSCHVEVSR